MRIKVGRIVNTDKPVNLMDLSPLNRVIAAAVNAYQNTPMYKRHYAETEEKKEEQRRKIRETLSEALLTAITPEIDGNRTLEAKNDICQAVLLKVPARFEPYLRDVTESHDFDAYSVVIVPPSKTVCKFCKPPTLLYVESREGISDV